MTYAQNQFQLTHLLQGVYDRLEETRGLLATGGSTTTIIDTGISDDEQDDNFKDYYAFVTRDAGGAGAAPEGEFAKCSAFTVADKTLTFPASSFSAAVAAGDRVTLTRNSRYPMNDVIRICNNALRENQVPVTDTSLTTASDQTEYTLPMAVKGQEILRVDYQGQTGDSNDNQWQPVRWSVSPAAPGTAETLIIQQLDSGLTLRIWYMGTHPLVAAFSDPISEYIPREHAIALCAFRVADWKRNVSKEILPILEARFREAQISHPFRRFQQRVAGMPQWTNPSTSLDPALYNRGDWPR